MDKEIKDKWVAALRSGDYPQTTGVLNRVIGVEEFNIKPGYCCLGVLIDVVDPKGWSTDTSGELKMYDGFCSVLSEHFLNRVGLNEHDAQKGIDMNDKQRATFAEIADMIEREF